MRLKILSSLQKKKEKWTEKFDKADYKKLLMNKNRFLKFWSSSKKIENWET